MEEKPQLAAESKDGASDEVIARRLQQQLNGEAAAAARRRSRKQPTFYSPQVLSCSISLQASWREPYTPNRPCNTPLPPKHHLARALSSRATHGRVTDTLTVRHLAPQAWPLRKWAMCILGCAQLCICLRPCGRRTLSSAQNYPCLQQSGGYSGYHGVEYASAEGEGREGEDAPSEAEHVGAAQAGRRAEAEGAMPASPSARRSQPEACSPNRCYSFPAPCHTRAILVQSL